MRGREAARAAARTDLVSGGLTTLGFHLRGYLDWCKANDLPDQPLPGSTEPSAETVLLRYLHSTMLDRDWAHGTCTQAAQAVAQHLVAHGHPDPRGTRTRGWMKARLRQTGTRRTRPVDAVSVSEVQSAAGKLVTEPDLVHLSRRRAVLALADALEQAGVLRANPLGGSPELRQLMALPASAFTVTATRIRVAVGDAAAVIVASDSPVHYELVAAGLADAADRPFPLYPAGVTGPDHTTANQARSDDSSRMRQALAHLVRDLPCSVPRRRRVSAAAARTWWTAASPAARLRLMARLDGHLPRRTQDLALVLTGIVGLHRHSDMRRLRLGDMEARCDGSGYDYVLGEHKGALLSRAQGSAGEPLFGALDHASADRDSCGPVCPACAMDRHLLLRREDGAGDDDALFTGVGTTAASVRVMRAVADAAVLADGSPRRIGARTMRVTGATWLREAGASYIELQDAGGWSSPALAELYVRRYDPWSVTLVLGLDEDPDGRVQADWPASPAR